MKMKSKYKKIFLVFMLLLVTCFTIVEVQAAVTSNKSGGVGLSTSTGADIFDGIGSVITKLLNMASTGVFSTITRLIVILEIVLFLVLYIVFAGATGSLSKMPMPDGIVFNRIALFDPNFVNPANFSISKGMGSILRDLFASFQTIAIAVFVIAAMVVGIQIALSTIASKKAQYKEAAVKWLMGLLLLIFIKFIVAGIFYLNEVLVSKLYQISNANVKIPIYFTDVIPTYGQALSGLVKGLENLTGLTLTAKASGYFGILLANICKGIGGNLIASIVGFVILGQTLTIIGAYLKRLFMAMLLGVIAPLVVAVDSINTATGKTSNIFKNWLQNFTITVFMQSIHAAYMVVLFQILGDLYGSATTFSSLNESQVAIVTIVLTTGLIKLEKMIKSVFGIGDSFAGELKDGSKGIIKAMGAVKGIAAGLQAVGDNKKKETTASKNRSILEAKLAEVKAGGGNTTINNNIANRIGPGGNPGALGLDTGSGSTPLGPSGSGGGKSSGDFIQDVLNEGKQPRTREEQIKALEDAIAQETTNEKSAKFARILAPANLAAGLGIGIGMGDEISEALFKGGHITKGLDFAAEKIGARAADRDRRSFAEAESRDGKKYDYTPSEKIIREKTTVEKTVSNGSLYVNPIAAEKEWKKTMSQMAEVFGDQVKKKMKEIDSNLDNN